MYVAKHTHSFYKVYSPIVSDTRRASRISHVGNSSCGVYLINFIESEFFDGLKAKLLLIIFVAFSSI